MVIASDIAVSTEKGKDKKRDGKLFLVISLCGLDFTPKQKQADRMELKPVAIRDRQF